jgi:hypothetical protein
VTKSTAAPFSASAYSNPKGLTATTAATASYDASAVGSFKLLNKFSLTVVGQSDANEEPTKSMTKWSSETLSNRTTNSVNASSNVSSFAIVVDINLKAVFESLPYCLTTGASPTFQA